MSHSATAVVQALTVSCWNCCHRLVTGLVPPPLPPTSPTALPAHARHPPLPRRYPLILHPPQYDQSGLSKTQIWGQHPSAKNIPVAPHHIQDKGQAPEAGILTLPGGARAALPGLVSHGLPRTPRISDTPSLLTHPCSHISHRPYHSYLPSLLSCPSPGLLFFFLSRLILTNSLRLS